jgi:hypothetical protein
MIVDMDNDKWQRVISLLSTHPWREVNDLLMEIGTSLRRNAEPQPAPQPRKKGNDHDVPAQP